MKIIKIDQSVFQKLRGGKTQDIYVHSNPIVRWLSWSKPKAVIKYINKINPKREFNVLDFGCGEGAFLPTLSKYFNEVDAMDLSTTEAKKLCKELRCNKVSFYEDLSDINKKYDIIVAMEVLEHIKDIKSITENLTGRLKKDGMLIVTGPSENFFYEMGRKVFGFTKPKDHYYSIKEIEEVLSKRARLIKRNYIPFNYLFSINPYTLLAFKKEQGTSD